MPIATRLAFVACFVPAPLLAGDARPACPARSAADHFFPAGSLDPGNPERDAGIRRWYSESLLVMGEPSLSCGDASATPEERESYRLIRLPSFDRPVSVRIVRSGRAVRVVVVELDHPHVAKAKVRHRSEKELPSSAWDALHAALRRADFWRLPVQVEKGRHGKDGVRWIVEGRSGRSHHVVDRWQPEGVYRELGELFLELGDP
jgi:hypothetical protein